MRSRILFLLLSLWIIISVVAVPWQVARAADTVNVTGNAQAVNSNGVIDFSGNNANVTITLSTKQFSGYGWSEDLGWIAFGTLDNAEGPVSYNETSGLLSGKAKALNTGNYLDFNAAPRNANVRVLQSGGMEGYAWSEDAGWFNFSGVSAVGATLTSPNAPANVAIYDTSNRATSDYALLVRWDQPTSFDAGNFQDYVIDRSTDGSTYAEVSTTTSRAYYDTNVATGTTYYYKIKTRNLTDVTYAASPVSLEPTGRYTTPPNLVGGPTAQIMPNSVIVTWTTDRAANSYVSVSEGNTFVSEQGQATYTTTHEVQVIGLKPQRSYSYVIKSMDEDGNELVGGAQAITTPNAPSVYDAEITNLTLDSGILNFKSTSVANFIIYYGTTANYGTQISERSDQRTTNHSIAITGLSPGTMYYYRILGEDSEGNELRSENSFSTLPLPTVNNFKIEPVKDSATTTLTATWTTNVPTTSTILYKTEGGGFTEKSLSELTATHKMEIGGLEDNARYVIYVEGRDQFGNVTRSSASNYTTPFDTRPPKITQVAMENSNIGAGARENESQIIVSWVTDEPSASQVEYNEGVSGDFYSRKTTPSGELTTKHLVVVSGLEAGKPYYFRAVSQDSSGNAAYSQSYSSVAGEAQKSILQLILNTLQSAFGWMGGFVD